MIAPAKQVVIEPIPLRLGESLLVRHRGGHTWATRLVDVNGARTRAELGFGISGVRIVRLYDTERHKAGTFTTRAMRWWHVDVGTLERIRAAFPRDKKTEEDQDDAV